LLTRSGRPLLRTDVWRIVKRAATLARVGAYPHAFRRSLATYLMRAGASVTAVQELLGHRKLDTTAQYLSVDRRDLHEAVEALERGLGRKTA